MGFQENVKRCLISEGDSASAAVTTEHLLNTLYLLPTRFKDDRLEAAYCASHRRKMQRKVVPISIIQSIISASVWTAFGVGLRGPSGLIRAYHVANAISTIASLLLSLFQFGVFRALSEYLLVFAMSLPLLCWMSWILIGGLSLQHADSEHLSWRITHSPEVLLKLWSDNISHVLFIILLILYDQVLQFRGGVADLVIHSLIIASYTTFRLLAIILLAQGSTTFILTECLNIVICVGLALLTYFGKFAQELHERIRFARNREERAKLRALRIQHIARADRPNRRAGGRNYPEENRHLAKTPIEILVSLLSRCQMHVRELAFEISTCGDLRMVEADELLKVCKDTVIANSHTDLFSVRDVLRSSTNRLAQDIVRAYSSNAANTQLAHPARLSPGSEWPSTQLHASEPESLSFKHSGRTTEWLKNPSSANLLGISASKGLFRQCGFELLAPLLSSAGLVPARVWNFLEKIENHYLPNPYHNHGHGLSVALFGRAIHEAMPIFRDRPDNTAVESELATLLLACLCHDVGHPGLNNNFYINEASTLGAVYRDRAILENYHSFLTFRLTQLHQSANIYADLSPAVYRKMRREIITLILATDMGRHFALISEMRMKREAAETSLSRLDLSVLIIKMADLSHAFLDWDLHVAWSTRISKEFYQQGELEQKLGLRQSALCEAQNPISFARSQVGFLEFVVLPLVTEVSATGEIPESVLQARCSRNIDNWKSVIEFPDRQPETAPIAASIHDYRIPMQMITQYLCTESTK